MKSRLGLMMLVAAFAMVALAPSARGQVQLVKYVIGSGATAATNGTTFAMAGTLGQTIIGRTTSSSHDGKLGFWYNPNIGTGIREEYNWSVTGATATMKVIPNPVIDEARITVALPTSGNITLRLFNALGQERLVLIDGYRTSGTTTVSLPASDLESGDYTLVLVANGRRSSTPMRVIK